MKKTRNFILFLSGAVLAVIAAVLCVSFTHKNTEVVYAAGETPVDYYWGLVPEENNTDYKLIISSIETDTDLAEAGKKGSFPSDAYYYSNSSPWLSLNNNEIGKSIVSAEIKGEVAPESTAYWFNYCSNLKSVDLTGLKTATTQSMEAMFLGCESLTSLDLSGFDTSNVTDMSSMFSSCGGLTSLDLSNFDTSNVTDMGSMFCNYSAGVGLSGTFGFGGTGINIGDNFKTSQVLDMGSMFSSCKGLTSIDLSSFDTSNVTDMSQMFSSCSGISGTFGFGGTGINIGNNFNTSNVTEMDELFGWCSGLTFLDLSSFDTANVTKMARIFCACEGLTGTFGKDGTGIKIGDNFITSNVTDMTSMFGSSGLTFLDLSSFDTSKVTKMDSMFGSRSISGSFGKDGTGIKIGDNFTTSNVYSMRHMFSYCEKLTFIDLTSFDTSKVTNMEEMFSGCKGLTGTFGKNGTSIKFGDSFTTSKVLIFQNMFSYTGLTEIDMSDLDITSNNFGDVDLFGYSGLYNVDKIKVTVPAADKMGTSTIEFPVSFWCDSLGKDAKIVTSAEAGTTWEKDDPHIEKTAATCTEKAVCEICGREYGEPLGHTLSNDNDCTKASQCDRCGEIVREAQSEHVYGEWHDNYDGNHYRECSNSCYGYNNCYVEDIQPHVYNENGHCTVCGGAIPIFYGVEFNYDGDADRYPAGIMIIGDKKEDVNAYESTEYEYWDYDSVAFDEEYTSYDYVYWYYFSPTSVTIKGNVAPTSTAYWFCNMTNLTAVDLSGLSTEKLTAVNDMFTGCTSLNTITAPAAITDGVAIALPDTFWCADAGILTGQLTNAVAGKQLIRHTAHILTERAAQGATCTAEGTVHNWECSICGKHFTDADAQNEVESVVAPKLAHTKVVDAAVAPTCTEKGLTAGEHCSVCNTVITAQTEVAALGHSYGEWSVYKAATTEEEGEERRICANDSTHFESRPIAKLDPISPTEPTEPTEPTDKDGGLSKGAIVGISVGCSLIVILAVYVLLYFLLYKKGVLHGKAWDVIFAPMNLLCKN